MSKTLIRALTLTALLSAGSAQAYVIDGNLSDWGVQRNGNAADWTPNNASATPFNSAIAYKTEDQNTSYLNPGYGGQAYDAEAIYLAWDARNMYIAIATGHNPQTIDNPSRNIFAAGDIAIDFGNNGNFEYGIELLGSGNTLSGHVYSNVTWALGLWKSNGSWTGYHDPNAAGNLLLADRTHPTSILGGTDVGTGQVAYTTIGADNYGFWTGDLHYFYEVSVPLSSFGADWVNGNPFTVHWTQNCANDSIWASATATRLSQNNSRTPKAVPEPGTLALLPMGMLGLLALRRKQGVR